MKKNKMIMDQVTNQTCEQSPPVTAMITAHCAHEQVLSISAIITYNNPLILWRKLMKMWLFIFPFLFTVNHEIKNGWMSQNYKDYSLISHKLAILKTAESKQKLVLLKTDIYTTISKKTQVLNNHQQMSEICKIKILEIGQLSWNLSKN